MRPATLSFTPDPFSASDDFLIYPSAADLYTHLSSIVTLLRIRLNTADNVTIGCAFVDCAWFVQGLPQSGGVHVERDGCCFEHEHEEGETPKAGKMPPFLMDHTQDEQKRVAHEDAPAASGSGAAAKNEQVKAAPPPAPLSPAQRLAEKEVEARDPSIAPVLPPPAAARPSAQNADAQPIPPPTPSSSQQVKASPSRQQSQASSSQGAEAAPPSSTPAPDLMAQLMKDAVRDVLDERSALYVEGEKKKRKKEEAKAKAARQAVAQETLKIKQEVKKEDVDEASQASKRYSSQLDGTAEASQPQSQPQAAPSPSSSAAPSSAKKQRIATPATEGENSTARLYTAEEKGKGKEQATHPPQSTTTTPSAAPPPPSHTSLHDSPSPASPDFLSFLADLSPSPSLNFTIYSRALLHASLTNEALTQEYASLLGKEGFLKALAEGAAAAGVAVPLMARQALWKVLERG